MARLDGLNEQASAELPDSGHRDYMDSARKQETQTRSIAVILLRLFTYLGRLFKNRMRGTISLAATISPTEGLKAGELPGRMMRYLRATETRHLSG